MFVHNGLPLALFELIVSLNIALLKVSAHGTYRLRNATIDIIIGDAIQHVKGGLGVLYNGWEWRSKDVVTDDVNFLAASTFDRLSHDVNNIWQFSYVFQQTGQVDVHDWLSINLKIVGVTEVVGTHELHVWLDAIQGVVFVFKDAAKGFIQERNFVVAVQQVGMCQDDFPGGVVFPRIRPPPRIYPKFNVGTFAPLQMLGDYFRVSVIVFSQEWLLIQGFAKVTVSSVKVIGMPGVVVGSERDLGEGSFCPKITFCLKITVA